MPVGYWGSRLKLVTVTTGNVDCTHYGGVVSSVVSSPRAITCRADFIQLVYRSVILSGNILG